MKSITRDDLLLVFIMTIWGFNYVAIKLALREIDPLAFVTLRNSIALLVLLVIFFLTERNWTLRPADIGRLVVIGIAGISINQLAFNVGLKYTSAANGSLLITTSPIFGLIFGIFLEKERVSGRRWLGVAAGLIGVAMIIAGGQDELKFGFETIGGDLLILAAASSFALYSVLARPILKVYSPLQLTLYATIVGVPCLFPLTTGAILAQPWGHISSLAWTMALYAGLLISLTNVLWYRSVHKLGSSRPLIFMYLVPLFAVISAVIVLKEGLGIVQLIGAVVALVGINVARKG